MEAENSQEKEEGQKTEFFVSEVTEMGRSRRGGGGSTVVCVAESQVEERVLN